MLYYAVTKVTLTEPVSCGPDEKGNDLTAGGYMVNMVVDAPSPSEAIKVIEVESLLADPPRDYFPNPMPGVIDEIQLNRHSIEELRNGGIQLEEKNEKGILYRTGFALFQNGGPKRKWWQFWKTKGYIIESTPNANKPLV